MNRIIGGTMFQDFERPSVDLRHEWMRIPSFPGYEINWSGEVRDYASKKIVQPVTEANVFVRLIDRLGKLHTKRVQDMRNQAFYPKIRASTDWHLRHKFPKPTQ